MYARPLQWCEAEQRRRGERGAQAVVVEGREEGLCGQEQVTLETVGHFRVESVQLTLCF